MNGNQRSGYIQYMLLVLDSSCIYLINWMTVILQCLKGINLMGNSGDKLLTKQPGTTSALCKLEYSSGTHFQLCFRRWQSS